MKRFLNSAVTCGGARRNTGGMHTDMVRCSLQQIQSARDDHANINVLHDMLHQCLHGNESGGGLGCSGYTAELWTTVSYT